MIVCWGVGSVKWFLMYSGTVTEWRTAAAFNCVAGVDILFVLSLLKKKSNAYSWDGLPGLKHKLYLVLYWSVHSTHNKETNVFGGPFKVAVTVLCTAYYCTLHKALKNPHPSRTPPTILAAEGEEGYWRAFRWGDTPNFSLSPLSWILNCCFSLSFF